MEWKNFLEKLSMEIIVSIAAGIIIAAVVWVLRRNIKSIILLIRKDFLLYLSINKRAKRCLKELKKNKIQHPVARYLMNFIAKESGIHLFNSEGEKVSISEYAEILYKSIDSNFKILREIYFIERTLPSAWYHDDSEPAEKREAIELVRKYFELQKNLKKEKGDKVTLKRYLVVPKSDFETDPKKNEFIEEHIVDRLNKWKIEPYLCPLEKLPRDVRDRVKDTTIFIDENGKGWAVEGLNFSQETLKRIQKNPEEPHSVSVRIEDRQNQIDSYITLIKKLEMHASKLIE